MRTYSCAVWGNACKQVVYGLLDWTGKGYTRAVFMVWIGKGYTRAVFMLSPMALALSGVVKGKREQRERRVR